MTKDNAIEALDKLAFTWRHKSDEGLLADYETVKAALENSSYCKLKMEANARQIEIEVNKNQNLKAEIVSLKAETIDCTDCTSWKNNHCEYFDSDDLQTYDCSMYYKQKNKKLKAEIARLIKNSEVEIKELNEEVIVKEQEITKLKDSLAHFMLDIEALNKENRHLHSEITRLSALLDEGRLYEILDKLCNECSCLGCNQAERLNLFIKEIRNESEEK